MELFQETGAANRQEGDMMTCGGSYDCIVPPQALLCLRIWLHSIQVHQSSQSGWENIFPYPFVNFSMDFLMPALHLAQLQGYIRVCQLLSEGSTSHPCQMPSPSLFHSPPCQPIRVGRFCYPVVVHEASTASLAEAGNMWLCTLPADHLWWL